MLVGMLATWKAGLVPHQLVSQATPEVILAGHPHLLPLEMKAAGAPMLFSCLITWSLEMGAASLILLILAVDPKTVSLEVGAA